MDNTAKGYAFLEFNSIEESEEAKQKLSDLHFYGRKIVVEFAHQ